jgi:hypothetical protein
MFSTVILFRQGAWDGWFCLSLSWLLRLRHCDATFLDPQAPDERQALVTFPGVAVPVVFGKTFATAIKMSELFHVTTSKQRTTGKAPLSPSGVVTNRHGRNRPSDCNQVRSKSHAINKSRQTREDMPMS